MRLVLVGFRMFEAAYRKQSESGRSGSIDAATFNEIPAAAKNVKIEGNIRLVGHMYEIQFFQTYYRGLLGLSLLNLIFAKSL